MIQKTAKSNPIASFLAYISSRGNTFVKNGESYHFGVPSTHSKTTFNGTDFVDSSGMSSTVERGNEPNLNDLENLFLAQHVVGNAEDIQVVVPTAKLGRKFVNDRRGAYSGKFICCNTHSNAGAADQNAAIRFAGTDVSGDFHSNVGVVRGLLSVNRRTKFTDNVTFLP